MEYCQWYKKPNSDESYFIFFLGTGKSDSCCVWKYFPNSKLHIKNELRFIEDQSPPKYWKELEPINPTGIPIHRMFIDVFTKLKL